MQTTLAIRSRDEGLELDLSALAAPAKIRKLNHAKGKSASRMIDKNSCMIMKKIFSDVEFDAIVLDLIRRFDGNSPAVAELIVFVVEVAGLARYLRREDFQGDIHKNFENRWRESDLDGKCLVNNTDEQSKFALSQITSFLCHFTTSTLNIDFSAEFINHLVKLTLSKVRFLRHTATLCMTGVVEGLFVLAHRLNRERKIGEHPDLIKDQQKLTNALRVCMKAVVDRALDLHPPTRIVVLQASEKWVTLSDDCGLDVNLVGTWSSITIYGASDPHPPCRLQAVQSIIRHLNEIGGLPESMQNEALLSQLVQRAWDKDHEVRLSAIKMVNAMMTKDLPVLQGDDFDRFVNMIWSQEGDLKVRGELAKFINNHLLSDPGIIRDIGNGTERLLNVEIDVMLFTEFCAEFGDGKMHCLPRVVESYWDSAPSLHEVAHMLDLVLLGETKQSSVRPLTVEHRSALIHIISACVDQAIVTKDKDILSSIANALARNVAAIFMLFRSDEQTTILLAEVLQKVSSQTRDEGIFWGPDVEAELESLIYSSTNVELLDPVIRIMDNMCHNRIKEIACNAMEVTSEYLVSYKAGDEFQDGKTDLKAKRLENATNLQNNMKRLAVLARFVKLPSSATMMETMIVLLEKRTSDIEACQLGAPRTVGVSLTMACMETLAFQLWIHVLQRNEHTLHGRFMDTLIQMIGTDKNKHIKFQSFSTYMMLVQYSQCVDDVRNEHLEEMLSYTDDVFSDTLGFKLKDGFNLNGIAYDQKAPLSVSVELNIKCYQGSSIDPFKASMMHGVGVSMMVAQAPNGILRGPLGNMLLSKAHCQLVDINCIIKRLCVEENKDFVEQLMFVQQCVFEDDAILCEKLVKIWHSKIGKKLPGSLQKQLVQGIVDGATFAIENELPEYINILFHWFAYLDQDDLNPLYAELVKLREESDDSTKTSMVFEMLLSRFHNSQIESVPRPFIPNVIQ